MKDLDIVPECFIDTNLVETLLHLKQVDTDGVNHQKGCNTVVRVMTTSKALKDSFALGIVDADKRPLSYVKNECNEIARSRHIVLLKHARCNHYFLQIIPAMDRLILDCAKDAGVDMEDYGLPSGLKAFTEASKQVQSKNDPRFKRLFRELYPVPEMTLLANLLHYLREYKYTADTASLKALFA